MNGEAHLCSINTTEINQNNDMIYDKIVSLATQALTF